MKTKPRRAPWQIALERLLAAGWSSTRIAAALEVTAQSVQNWRGGMRPHARSRRDLVDLAARARETAS